MSDGKPIKYDEHQNLYCIRGHTTTTYYMDQILPNFDPPPRLSGQKWTFYKLSTLCHMTHCELSTDPPVLVHVVFE